MKSSYWLFLSGAVACVAASSACSSDFTSCSASRTCPSGGAAGRGEAGQAGEVETEASAGATAVAGSAGDDSTSQSIAGQGGEAPEGPDIAGAAGEASACDAGVDFNSDAKNCGSCGHDCLGGDCDQGQCRPIAIAPDQDQPLSITTDGTYVYWLGTHDGAQKQIYVARRRVDRTDEIKVIAPSETSASGLAISQSSLYWLSRDQVRACDAPDCTGGARDILPTGSNRCLDVLFEASQSRLYWSCNSNYKQNDGQILAAMLPGSTVMNVEPTSGNPEKMASDDGNVYWGNSSGFNNQDALGSDAAIWRLRLRDGSKTRLVSGMTMEIGAMAVGGNSLYFSGFTGETSAIFRVSLPYGTPTPKKIADGPALGMVADERALYWSDCEKGLIKRCSHSDCSTPETIAFGQNCPTAMAQDSVSVYWISSSITGGVVEAYPIQRLAK